MSKTNILPKRPANDWWARLTTAWAILRGAPYPQPLPWYDSLYPIVSNEYAVLVEQAVEKVEREFRSSGCPDLRRKEAAQWFRHYAVAAGKNSDVQPWMVNFLIEWWVARKKGRF